MLPSGPRIVIVSRTGARILLTARSVARETNEKGKNMKVTTMSKKAGSEKTKKVTKSAGPKTVVQVGEYNGHAMFGIHDAGRLANGEEYSQIVQFGVRKAKAILAHIDELRGFVAENDK